jgi:lactate dehydrogenase-like 2-hydroxyacid dehydrogenase
MRAALDVFENEPEIHPRLKTNPNVVRHFALPERLSSLIYL